MSKAREFWTVKRKHWQGNRYIFDKLSEAENQITKSQKEYRDECELIKLIELTPEVSRKLELFDEAVELLREACGSVIFQKQIDEIETFLKKLGEHNE